jgi:peptide-methionine (R)-S-oxide reductase
MSQTLSRRTVLAWLAASSALAGCGTGTAKAKAKAFPVSFSEAEWRRRLTPAQFYILRQHGTETPGSSPLLREHRRGTFVCAADGHRLFSSTTKYDSRTGWPSFTAPLDNAVGTKMDYSMFIPRVEVHCRRCGGHLGHVFDDGPAPTGKRYCMNGAAMTFKPASGRDTT